ncbi:MAG: hypothetical protein OQL06_07735 [Gammaproteobacteria bacterium]|nr:hypothetical protein [Gammaproteobacteria bacterium]
MKPQPTGSQIFLATLLCLTTLEASAIMAIRPAPAKEHQHDRRAPKIFNLTGHENSQIKFLTPDLQSSDIKSDNGQIALHPTGKDNYHALYASREHNGVQESAIRYVYFNGKPTGRSPSEITFLNKTDFEIIPDPLAREHWHYKAGDEIAFVIRFKNTPLALHPASLATSNASVLESLTDTQGRVVFVLPDDFAKTIPHARANEPGELLIHAKHADHGNRYATWLSSDYQVSPEHWQSTELGAMVVGGGFLFGAFVTGLGFKRRRKKGEK